MGGHYETYIGGATQPYGFTGEPHPCIGKSKNVNYSLTQIRCHAIIKSNFKLGERKMATSGGKADKGRKQQKKKPQHTLKEKRKLKEEKKNKTSTGIG
jgi:hypothetical protein